MMAIRTTATLNKEIHSSFTFMNIDEAVINKIIYNLPPKISTGCDGISSKLLKVIAPIIIKQLTLLINQVLNTGTFPDKIAKVIPIFKKGDPSLFENYRPLPAISKVLENIIAFQCSSISRKINFCLIINMDLDQNIVPNMLHWN